MDKFRWDESLVIWLLSLDSIFKTYKFGKCIYLTWHVEDWPSVTLLVKTYSSEQSLFLVSVQNHEQFDWTQQKEGSPLWWDQHHHKASDRVPASLSLTEYNYWVKIQNGWVQCTFRQTLNHWRRSVNCQELSKQLLGWAHPFFFCEIAIQKHFLEYLLAFKDWVSTCT